MNRSRSRSPIKFTEDNDVKESRKDVKEHQDDVARPAQKVEVSQEMAKHSQEDLNVSPKQTEVSQGDAVTSQEEADASQKDTETSWGDTEVSQKDGGVSTKDVKNSQDVEISHENAEMSQEHVEESWDGSQISREDAEITEEYTEVSHADNLSNTKRFGHNFECRDIVIGKIAKHWTHEKAYQFIQEITKSMEILNDIKIVKMITYDDNPIGRCGVMFKSPQICKMAMKEWFPMTKEKKITVQYDHEKLLLQQRRHFRSINKGLQQMHKNMHNQPNPFNVSNDKPWNPDPGHETYGLSPQLLQRLDIKFPLCNTVYVKNLPSNVTDARIHEIFSHAGSIVNAKLIGFPNKYFAKVEYDHPVEAVQAISMFNLRELYGRPMIVHMKNPTKNMHFPDGLSSIGPGLGVGGQPLRGVRIAMEIESLKRTLLEEINKVKKAKSNQTTNVSNINPFQQVGAIFPTNNQMPVMPPQNNPFVAPTPIMPWNFLTPQQVSVPNMQLLPNTSQQDTSALQQASNVLQQATNSILQNQNKMAPNIADMSQASVQASPWQNTVPANTQNNSTQPGFSRMDNISNDFTKNQNNDNYQMKVAPNVTDMLQASLQASPWLTVVPANIQNDSIKSEYTGMDQTYRSIDYMNNQNNDNNQMTPNVAFVPQASVQTSPWQTSVSANTQKESVQSSYSSMDIKPNDFRINQNIDNNQMNLAPNKADMPKASVQTSSRQSSGSGHNQNDSEKSRHSSKDNRSNESRKNDSHKKKSSNDDKYDKREKPRSSSRDERRSKSDKSDMLIFKNLPPSVSVKVLTSKMKEVGEVKFAELTGNGRAVVRFVRSEDTKRCIKLFHKSRVDGKTIEVRYF